MNRQEVRDALTYTPTEEFLARRRELSAAADEAGLDVDEINAALSARPDLPRPLSPGERAVLLALLGAADFDGRDVLLEQVDSATVVGYCPCPCATVALEVPPSARRAPRMPERTIPNQAGVLNAEGQTIGGIIVFADEGYLSAIEIFDYGFDYGDGPISPLPSVDRLELGRFEEQPGEVRPTWLGRSRRGRGPRLWRPLS